MHMKKGKHIVKILLNQMRRVHYLPKHLICGHLKFNDVKHLDVNYVAITGSYILDSFLGIIHLAVMQSFPKN